MKVLRLLIVVALMASMLFGCATIPYAIPYAIEAAEAVASFTSSTSKGSGSDSLASSSSIQLDKKLEKHEIGKYEVIVAEGNFERKPCYLFFLSFAGSLNGVVYYEKNDKNDMQEMEAYFKMNDADKRKFIKKSFIKYAKLDLGPVESETPKETTVSTPSSLSSIPTPGFAPVPLPR